MQYRGSKDQKENRHKLMIYQLKGHKLMIQKLINDSLVSS